jgi:hypothetical protein
VLIHPELRRRGKASRLEIYSLLGSLFALRFEIKRSGTNKKSKHRSGVEVHGHPKNTNKMLNFIKKKTEIT